MIVYSLKINGMKNPLGFLMNDIRVAWKVSGNNEEKVTWVKIQISKNPEMTEITASKEGTDLDSAGTKIEMELKERTRYYVRVIVTDAKGKETSSETAFFETAKGNEKWKGAWITTDHDDSFHPVFRKRFSVEKEIKQARLYLSGLGLFISTINGEKIGEEILTPYYSHYHEEVQYLTFDITKQIQAENELRVKLGNGWYKGRFGLAGKKENFGSRFQMIAEIHLQFQDGTNKVIGSDESWSYKGSDTESSDIYDGETIDHTLWEGRKNPWRKVVLCSKSDVKGTIGPSDRLCHLTARYSTPVKEMERLPVKEVISTPKGECVLDFGQNFAGYPEFWADFPKGCRIDLDFGEILQEGNFYNENYRTAKSHFTYISGGKPELVKPEFTYFGFRYVRVTGWPGKLNPSDFTGIVIYSQMQQTGFIETGHAGVNRLFSNALWGQKSNSIDFPTDCPQRDERLGWTGDAQVFSGTASYNMDTAAFYHKFIHDLRTEQKRLDGVLPGVIPVFEPDAAIFSSVWGDIATFLPMVLFEHYGDREALRACYPMMKDWVDKITREDQRRGQRYLYDFGDQLGDWLALDGRTQQSMKGGTDDYYIGSCYYAASVYKTAEAAKELGYSEDESYYRNLYASIYQAILKEYFSENGRLCIDTQTAYIVALYLGIYKDKDRIIQGLKERLYKDCYQLKGGFVGAPVMCRVMAENGMEEEASYFLLQKSYPGWMHCIDLGATTIWERWNSVLDSGLLSGTMMNSLNHYSFGAVVEYLYRDVAGLKALEPGFKKVSVTPLLNRKLRFMKMSYESVYGKYRVEWEIRPDGLVNVLVEVPFGCRAVITLPYYEGDIQETGTGIHEYEYRPTVDLQCLYTKKTLFKEMMQDERAMEIIGRISPLLQHFLSSGDEEFLNESLETLRGMSFLGFSEKEIEGLINELTRLNV